MNVGMRQVLLGTMFGFLLSSVGFTRWDEVHAMMTFADLRLFLTFAVAVAAAAAGFALIARGRRMSQVKVHPGIFPGGLLFGAGWAIAGACPAIAFVQLGEGRVLAASSLLGIFLGNWIYSRLHPRLFRWDPGSCGS
jgi:hypothetical protein